MLAALIVIPLLATDMLPTPQSVHGVRGDAAAAAATTAATAAARGAAAAVSRWRRSIPNAAPIEAPKEIKPEPPAPPSYSMGGVVGGVAGGIPGGTAGGVVGGIPRRRRPRRRRRRRCASVATSRNRRRSRTCKPVYPPIAQTAKVQGIVIIEAIIGKDGTVKDAKVLRSVPLLDQAALDAVQQWTLHADAAQRPAGRSRHDRHGELHAELGRRATLGRLIGSSVAPARAVRTRESLAYSTTRFVFGGWNGRSGSDGTCGNRWAGSRRSWPSFWSSCRCGRLAWRLSGTTRSPRRASSRSCTRRRWPST